MTFKDWFFFWRRKKTRQIIDNRYSIPERVYTPLGMLKIGMYVIELDRPWLETEFLFQGFEIKTEEDIEALKAQCNYVYIDTTKLRKGKPINVNKTRIEPKSQAFYPAPQPKLSFFEDEIRRAEETYQSTGALVADFMDRIAKGDSPDTKLAKQAVAECVNSILHSPDATLWLTQLKNKDEYTAQHSLNVCVLSIVLGRHINLSEGNLNDVGLCGLMHDVGKMLVPLHILNKPGKLTSEEQIIMQSHTTLGHELLKSSQGMYIGAINTALSHHERLDGKGYPLQIGRNDLSLYTKIVTIADLYDAITSDRVYQQGRTHLEATKIMFDLIGQHLDETLVVKFVESLGVYPPGCFVELTNGAVGLVIEVNEKFKLRPKVMLILDEDKNPASEVIIDLSFLPEDLLGNIFTIRGIIKAADYGIDSVKYYQEGVLQKGFVMGKRSIQTIATSL
jgi:HD-GYP domain-containing protein (c-di-GMP phosphodiesterase class II)